MLPTRDTLTFLFTDIERSSQLWEMHPQAMGRALALHDDLMREVFEEFEGHVFKTIGDAFCVAFANSLNAVLASVSAQRKLSAAAWEETGPLRVRMALHRGEAERRDGDYFGPTLNRVARVLATGHGGQTLLSWVTAESVRDELDAGIALRDLGERRLKDLSHPERIFQLVVEDLPADFPPLRSLEVLPNNLPAQVTSFVGRAREMAEVKRLLGTTRLLTLTGPGGTGKTRLSLQVAAEVLDRFTHGVWLIELATVSDPDLVPETIANVVDVRGEAGRPALDTLIDALRTRRLLLVLDNCEHLIAACAQTVAALLRRCPGLEILASSREPLNIAGETIWGVPTLAVPEFYRGGEDLGFEELAELEAVQLFVERASASRRDFALTRENAQLVARICWRLDGIPLAIELAAARIKSLPLPQILSRLDDRFRLLSGGSRTALPRQQTLGALIDWSYELLSEPERILLRRLAVFVAGRTLEMAEDVCAGDGVEREDIFDLISALVDKSLLTVEPGWEGESRYTMLESIWDYADSKLTQHGEGERYRHRHLEYFVRLAEELEPELFGHNQRACFERLSLENPNVNTALTVSLNQPDSIELGLRLAGALTRYWEVRSYLTEGYEHFQNLLQKAPDNLPPAVRAKAELGAGRLSWCQDRDADVLRHCRAAQRIYEELGRMEDVGMIESFIGYTERNEGDNATARLHFQRAREIGEKLGSKRLLAVVLNGFGSLAADEGDFETARKWKEQALEQIRALGDRWAMSLITGSLGEACFRAGDYASSKKLIREAITLSRELGNKWTAAYGIEAIARIYAEEGHAPKGVRLYGAASSQREALALNFSPTEKVLYQVSLNRLHELTPLDVFEEEWANGRSLGLQRAVELALDADT